MNTFDASNQRRDWIPLENPCLPSRHFTVDALRGEGFEGFVSFHEIRTASPVPPAAAGIYVVMREPSPPVFLADSRGGRFKGRDPTETLDVLQGKWVPDASILYIGRGVVLYRRLKQYAGFGAGLPVGHWGGRYIWQLADSASLRVAWKICAIGETPAQLEAEFAHRFKRRYCTLPFANISDPSARL